jgi:hypothetical protein
MAGVARDADDLDVKREPRCGGGSRKSKRLRSCGEREAQHGEGESCGGLTLSSRVSVRERPRVCLALQCWAQVSRRCCGNQHKVEGEQRSDEELRDRRARLQRARDEQHVRLASERAARERLLASCLTVRALRSSRERL